MQYLHENKALNLLSVKICNWKSTNLVLYLYEPYNIFNFLILSVPEYFFIKQLLYFINYNFQCSAWICIKYMIYYGNLKLWMDFF